jgi:hypothetical protein
MVGPDIWNLRSLDWGLNYSFIPILLVEFYSQPYPDIPYYSDWQAISGQNNKIKN